MTLLNALIDSQQRIAESLNLDQTLLVRVTKSKNSLYVSVEFFHLIPTNKKDTKTRMPVPDITSVLPVLQAQKILEENGFNQWNAISRSDLNNGSMR
jgi:hypothetical protein